MYRSDLNVSDVETVLSHSLFLLQALGGLATDIKGWGKEDVDLFEKAIAHKRLRILRAPEPQMVHVYHPVVCDEATVPEAQYKMCLGSRDATYSSVESMTERLLQMSTQQKSYANNVDRGR